MGMTRMSDDVWARLDSRQVGARFVQWALAPLGKLSTLGRACVYCADEVLHRHKLCRADCVGQKRHCLSSPPWPSNEQLSRIFPAALAHPVAAMKFAKYVISCIGDASMGPILTLAGNSSATWCLNGG
jgi:hypothetical protein